MSQRDAALLQQIAQYAGAINRHEKDTRSRANWRSNVTPYPRSHRSTTRRQTTQNRTLILDGSRVSRNNLAGPQDSHWVSSRDRGHMTLVNLEAYEATTASKLARIETSREARRKVRLMKQDARELERLRLLASTTLVHNGATYRFNRKANLLLRVDLDKVSTNPTPSRTLILGVEFMKSPKSDNLFRKTTIKLHAKREGGSRSKKKFCKYFTRTGVCKNAKACSYVHDMEHRALCMHFMSSHGCDETRECNLSHIPVPENTPICAHHLNGTCNKTDCKYTHYSVSPSAPICPEFARNGFCARGSNCSMQHIRECPLFSNKGTCRLKNCKLPHIVRAGRITRNTKNSPQTELSGESSDSESDSGTDEYESEDFDENAFGDFVKL